MIPKHLESLIRGKIEKLGLKSPPEIVLEFPREDSHGDLAFATFALAKSLNQPPMEIAKKIAGAVTEDIAGGKLKFLSKVEAAAPGFVNFYLSPSFFHETLKNILSQANSFGSSDIGRGKTVVIDYSSPNIAKPFGIGHLRSTIIGQAIYNLYKFVGYKTIGDNHLGDWGTQFGKLIYQIELKVQSSNFKVEDLSIADLERLYVDFHKKAAEDPSLDEKARDRFKKLEAGEPSVRKIWQYCVDISLREFKRIYDLLGVKIDLAYGESFYQDKMRSIIDLAKKKKLAVESEGALVIFFPECEKMPPLILSKSDEASTYATRDLAAIKFRQDEFGPVQKIIYEVGVDQALHFRQLFLAAGMLGLAKRCQFTHIAHGMMRFADGKMSTRTGKTILLEKVLQEAVTRARKIVEAKNSKLSDKEKTETAQVVGIGAVKYNDLSQDPKTEIVFDWDKMLNLEGNSAPYLQYTYARARSVLRKANIDVVAASYAASSGRDTIAQLQEESNILRHLWKFPVIVEEAANSYSPNLVANYLFDLAQRFNLFYNNVPILESPEKERAFRLALTAATAQVIRNGVRLLGIEVLERM